MYIIFLGAPGAGKGTQAAGIAADLNLAHVATGDLFRKALQQGTELGLKAKAYMEKGTLVPDDVTIQMVMERLAEPDCAPGAILDGFPRTLAQAKALDKALAKRGSGIDRVIYIKVGEEELLKRLGGRWICRQCQTPYHEIGNPPKVKGKCDKCGGELYQRTDDKPEAVKKRLQVYFAETAPLTEYYTSAGKLTEVDGEGTVDDIRQRISAVISRHLIRR